MGDNVAAAGVCTSILCGVFSFFLVLYSQLARQTEAESKTRRRLFVCVSSEEDVLTAQLFHRVCRLPACEAFEFPDSC